MANRKDFMINALIDVILDWTDGDSKLAIQEIIDKGVQPNELLGFFDSNTIVEALSDNETPPEIAAKTAQTADTKEGEATDLVKFVDLLKKFSENMPLTFKVYEDDYHINVYIMDDDGDTNEWQFNKASGKYYGMYTYEREFEDYLNRRGIPLDD